MSIKVLGAGFGRTGTNSLKIALEILGYGPCYHMYEVKNNPEHVDIWNNAIDGNKISWQELSFSSRLANYFIFTSAIAGISTCQSYFDIKRS